MASRKMSEVSSERRSALIAALLLFAQFTTLGTALLGNLLMARALGASGRGEVAFALQASYIITVAGVLGRDRGFIAVGLKTPYLAQLRLALGLLVLPTTFATLLSCALGIVLGLQSGLSVGTRTALVVSLLTAGLMASRMLRAASISGGRAVSFVLVSALCQFALALSLALLFFADIDEVRWWLASYCVASLLPLLLLSALIVVRGREHRSSSGQTEVRRKGRALIPTSVAEIMVLRLERFILPIFSGYASLGVYVAVATITELASWPMQQYLDSRVPYWANGNRLKRQYLRELAVSIVFTGTIAAGISIVTYLSLTMVFGPQFAAGKDLVAPLGLAAFGLVVYRFHQNVSAAHDLQSVLKVTAILSLVGSLVGYPVAIATGGALGAAWASAIIINLVGAVGVLMALRRVHLEVSPASD